MVRVRVRLRVGVRDRARVRVRVSPSPNRLSSQPALQRAARSACQLRRVHRPHVLPREERVQVREVAVAQVGLGPCGRAAAPLAQTASLRRASLLREPTWSGSGLGLGLGLALALTLTP